MRTAWIAVRDSFVRFMGAFRSLPMYVKGVARIVQNLLWGEGLLAAACTVYSLAASQFPWRFFISVGVVLAGFFLWHDLYRRTIRAFRIARYKLKPISDDVL